MLRLRSSRFSRCSTSRHRIWRFPFKKHPIVLPNYGARSPLSPHFNPLDISIEQSRSFPSQYEPSLSSFCKTSFKKYEHLTLGPLGLMLNFSPLVSLRAGYATRTPEILRLRHTLVGFYLKRAATLIKPPRREGHRPHAIVDRPDLLNSQHQPLTGRQKQSTRSFIDVPDDGFLGPPSEMGY